MGLSPGIKVICPFSHRCDLPKQSNNLENGIFKIRLKIGSLNTDKVIAAMENGGYGKLFVSIEQLI